jgi:hypothetical protein
LKQEFPRILAKTIKRLHHRGVKIVLLSAGVMDYSEAAAEQYRRWLSEAPPYILTSRDEFTFQAVGDAAKHAYNGIDIAFFASEFHKPAPVLSEDFVIFNFDKLPEPCFEVLGSLRQPPGLNEFEFNRQLWKYRFPKWRRVLTERFWPYQYLDALWPDSLVEAVGGFRIIRTEHRFNPTITRKTYKGPNAFASDIPETYLDLYAQTECTFSDRVHACVATLSYGNPAMLFSSTPRSRLFERLNLESIRNQVTRLDPGVLRAEKEGLVQFLKSVM